MSAYERNNPPTPDDYEQPTRPVRQVDREVIVDRPGRDPVDYDYDTESEHARRIITYRRISAVIWTITGFIEILIGLRILFKLLAANAGNGFVNFIYNLSGVFVNPFQGMVNDVTSGSTILEINSLIAMLLFALLAWGVMKLVWLILSVTEPTNV
ncbi:MAG: hypothetical protein WBW04_22765 [Nitrolancea sp.]